MGNGITNCYPDEVGKFISIPHPHLLTAAVRGRRPLTCAASGPGSRGGGRRVRPRHAHLSTRRMPLRSRRRARDRVGLNVCWWSGVLVGGRRPKPEASTVAEEPAHGVQAPAEDVLAKRPNWQA